MRHPTPRVSRIARRAATLLGLALLLPLPASAAEPGQALVIGEGSYTSLPRLPACTLSAHSVAAGLRRLGFTVEEQEDATSGAMFAGIATLTRRIKASPDAPVFVYVCGYASAFDERPFLLPVSAQVARPADLLTQGVLAKSVIDAITRNTKAPAMIVLDAIPMPTAPASLALDRLAQDLTDSVGLLAVHDSGTGDRPTPLAAILAPALHGPALKGATLLAQLKPQLSGHPTPQIAALHMPSDQLYLAGASTAAAPAAATPAVPAAPAAAPAPTAAPAAAPSAAAALPDEDQMTEAQRKQVQQALAMLGYYDGRNDGIFGPETRAAIRRWQHEAHVPMTGHLTASQATRLTSG